MRSRAGEEPHFCSALSYSWRPAVESTRGSATAFRAQKLPLDKRHPLCGCAHNRSARYDIREEGGWEL